jgi:NRAMP (natural resistance-associated macrophage protein)-like metal ion transporter
MLKSLRSRIAVFFAVLGPGFITAMVDNDAGGIFTYSEAGARYGYMPLWSLVPITLILIVSQEMCSRMGAVTGKGLSDLIREEFGLRTTFLVMAGLLLVNLTNVAANFAGIASSLELFHVNRYLSVPICAFAVWALVVKGTYRGVEKVFLLMSTSCLAYVVSAILVEPDWITAVQSMVRPELRLDGAYLAMVVGLVGTSVAPWMQFYLQAAIVEKGIDAEQYRQSRVEVVMGCVTLAFMKFFVIVCAAGAIWAHGPREIHDAAEAAQALQPLGPYAYLLFSAALFSASLLASSILPLSTAYSVCEGMGFESGVNRRFEEAPTFYGLYTLLIVLGAGMVLWPGFPLVRAILFSQVLNGVLLPVILYLIVSLASRRDLMGKWANRRYQTSIAWVAVVALLVLSAAMTAVSLTNGM